MTVLGRQLPVGPDRRIAEPGSGSLCGCGRNGKVGRGDMGGQKNRSGEERAVPHGVGARNGDERVGQGCSMILRATRA